MTLHEKVEAKTARIAVLGLGYVGLPLAVEISGAGYKVTGIDLDEKRVASITEGRNYIPDVSDEAFQDLVHEGLLSATNRFSVLAEMDIAILCVPTPLTKHKEPDISHIVSATREISRHLHPEMLLVLESTTYPGTTEEVILPMLSNSGMTAGEDYYLAFSPERVDPGNRVWHISNTPKIMGGVTTRCTDLATALYRTFIDEVIPVSSPRVAEMIKLLENTFRAVNIALVNEVAFMCDKLNIDTWEVIEGAASKPFGFMPFFPGPGLGGHCIPIDPHYLSWKLKSLNYHARFIELAGEINSAMPQFVVRKISDALNDHGRPLKNSDILILGTSYKKDVGDMRESPAVEIIHALVEKGSRVSFHDPYVPRFVDEGIVLESVPLDVNLLRSSHCVAILTDHTVVDYAWIVRESPLVVDTRNATRGIVSEKIRKI